MMDTIKRGGRMKDDITVGILMHDGSVASPDDKPKCHRCKATVEWSHLDELGELNLELYGVLCWACLADAQRYTSENGY